MYRIGKEELDNVTWIMNDFMTYLMITMTEIKTSHIHIIEDHFFQNDGIGSRRTNSTNEF
jgi:hypothetical protein